MHSLSFVLPLALAAIQMPESEVYLAFEAFKIEFGRTYDTENEARQRFAIFRANLEKIDVHNAQNLSYRLGVTQFSDRTHAEFLQQTASAWGDVSDCLFTW